LADPRKGRYFLACCHGEVVGQMMHTWEWSDWRNGQIWWLQSVYVLPEFRRRGVFRRLFAHLQQQAESDPEVIGLRLYVEAGNQTALETYRRMGLESAGYLVLEQIFSE
jgi:ribosomal protein S18 acetylase RimI-like enzyme